jgi:hypothetical protein
MPDFTMCRQNLPNYLASVHPNCSDLAKGRAVSSPPVQIPHNPGMKLWLLGHEKLGDPSLREKHRNFHVYKDQPRA